MIIKTFGEYLCEAEKAGGDVIYLDGQEADSYAHDNIRLKTIIENSYFKEEIKQIFFDKDGEVREDFLDLDTWISGDESSGTCSIFMDEGSEEYYTIKLDAPIRIKKDSIEVEDIDENNLEIAFYKRQLTLVNPKF